MVDCGLLVLSCVYGYQVITFCEGTAIFHLAGPKKLVSTRTSCSCQWTSSWLMDRFACQNAKKTILCFTCIFKKLLGRCPQNTIWEGHSPSPNPTLTCMTCSPLRFQTLTIIALLVCYVAANSHGIHDYHSI